MSEFNLFQGEDHQAFYQQGDGQRAALFIHGFMGTPANWRDIAIYFAHNGWTVDVPQLPGFGTDSARLRHINLNDWLEFITERWTYLRENYPQTMLAGHSMGGALGIMLAAENPPDHVTLTAPFWHLNISGWQSALLPLGALIIKKYRVFGDTNFNDPVTRAQFKRIAPDLDLDDPQIQHKIRDELTIPLSSINNLRKIGLRAFEQASQLHVPTLVIQGLQDVTVYPTHTRVLVEQMPQATLHEIEGTHDLPQSDSPTHPVVLEKMLAFIGEKITL